MADSQIITETVTVLEPDGPETYYTVKVIDEEGNVEATSSNDLATAQDNFNQVAEALPGANVNGSPPGTDQGPGAIFDTTANKKTTEAMAELSGQAGSTGENLKKYQDEGTEDQETPSATSNLEKAAEDIKGSPYSSEVGNMTLQERIQAGNSGVNGTLCIQARVNYEQCASQKILRNPDGNAFITLGKDRNGHTSSGYGGMAHTQCDAIDICVGMGGPKPKQTDRKGSKYWTSPNFFLDAARIYISQKTDVDENFAIGDVEDYHRSEAKSAIVLKADNIRLVGRESLKLVTNSDRRNSQGGEIHGWKGIHLMANNDARGLQPIPKGDNLIKALETLDQNIKKVAQTFQKYVDYQRTFNTAILEHTHNSPFYYLGIDMSVQIKDPYISNIVNTFGKTDLSIMKTEVNSAGFQNNFLTENGPNFINSRFNKTN